MTIYVIELLFTFVQKSTVKQPKPSVNPTLWIQI